MSDTMMCKPDWSIVCSSAGCSCEWRQPGQAPQQPLSCAPPLQIYCSGTMCMCTEVRVPPPVYVEPVKPGVADCGLAAALAATGLYKALLACR